jgi:hypothetical protein
MFSVAIDGIVFGFGQQSSDLVKKDLDVEWNVLLHLTGLVILWGVLNLKSKQHHGSDLRFPGG